MKSRRMRWKGHKIGSAYGYKISIGEPEVKE
jgi:hypothetical protein